MAPQKTIDLQALMRIAAQHPVNGRDVIRQRVQMGLFSRVLIEFIAQ